jgi:hypothetical protein
VGSALQAVSRREGRARGPANHLMPASMATRQELMNVALDSWLGWWKRLHLESRGLQSPRPGRPGWFAYGVDVLQLMIELRCSGCGLARRQQQPVMPDGDENRVPWPTSRKRIRAAAGLRAWPLVADWPGRAAHLTPAPATARLAARTGARWCGGSIRSSASRLRIFLQRSFLLSSVHVIPIVVVVEPLGIGCVLKWLQLHLSCPAT